MACVNRSMAALTDQQWQDAVPHGLFHFLRPCLFHSCPWPLTPGHLLIKAALSSHLFMTDTFPKLILSMGEHATWVPNDVGDVHGKGWQCDGTIWDRDWHSGRGMRKWLSSIGWNEDERNSPSNELQRVWFTFLDERVDGQQSPPSYWQYARLLMVSHQPSPPNGFKTKKKTHSNEKRNVYLMYIYKEFFCWDYYIQN